MGIGSVIYSNDSNSFWDLELAPDSEAPIHCLNVHLTLWKQSYQNRYTSLNEHLIGTPLIAKM